MRYSRAGSLLAVLLPYLLLLFSSLYTNDPQASILYSTSIFTPLMIYAAVIPDMARLLGRRLGHPILLSIALWGLGYPFLRILGEWIYAEGGLDILGTYLSTWLVLHLLGGLFGLYHWIAHLYTARLTTWLRRRLGTLQRGSDG